MPGLLFGSLSIPGLVQDPIDWGEWELPLLYTKVSGLVGETAYNGGTGKRQIVFEMRIYDAYATQAALFEKLGQVDLFAGLEQTLGVFDPTDTLQITLPKCVLMPIKLIKNRYDGIHGWWAHARITVRQLAQAVPEPDV